jgi:S1-C subfamily serine protease
VVDVAHSFNRRYVALLAFVACLILIVGWFVRPRDIPQSPLPVPSDTELQQLARRAQRRSLEDMTSYFAGVAADLNASLAYIPASTLTGIVWSETEVITGPMPFGAGAAAVAIRIGSRAVDTVPRVYGRQLPLAALDPPRTSILKGPRRAASLPHVGDWMVAVWQTGGEPSFAVANYRQLTETACGLGTVRELVSSLSLTHGMIGGGIFNMDGELLGMILPCNDHIGAIDPTSVDELLKRWDTLEQRLLGKYGVLFAPVSEGEAPYFKGINGLFVREVWNDAPAESAGLWPGDLLSTLNEHPAITTEDLRALASASDVAFDLKVQRGAKTLTVVLQPRPTAAVASSGTVPAAGLMLESAPKTYRIESVLPDGPAARAGIQPGDRLVRINRAEPRTAEQVMRAMTAAGRGPLLLEIERDQRRIAVVIP